MAKRRTAHPKRVQRLAHLTPDELTELARLGAHVSAVRKTVARRTITAVAEQAEINPSSLGELERGRTNVTYVILLRLAHALDVSVGDLIPPPLSAEDPTVDVEPTAP